MALCHAAQPHVHVGVVTTASPDTGGVAELAERLDHRFKTAALLREAVTHTSVAVGRRRDARHGYERLEFLGDRVLGLVVAHLLLDSFPKENEGAIAKRHTELVRRETLADIAREIDLGRFLRLSAGEGDSGGRDNPTILANACEAVIGALYLDGGLASADAFIRRYWTPRIDLAGQPPQDPKSALQQWALARGLPLPRYKAVARQGPDHLPEFTVEVLVEGLPAAAATGRSKRVAERAAAALMLGNVPP
jgi:ribonuclease-3